MNRIRIAILAAVVVAAATAFFALRPPGDGPAPAPGGPGGPPAGPPPAPAAPPAPAKPAGPFVLIVAAPADDRVVPEPCSRVVYGGLLSLRAFFDVTTAHLPKDRPTVPVFLGDATHARGEAGRMVSAFLWAQVVTYAEPRVAALGPGELSLGAAFVRGMFGPTVFAPLCANATDGVRVAVARAWAHGQVEGELVTLVGSVSESAGAEIEAAGSDIRISPPAPAVEAAVASSDAEAARLGRRVAARVLFHHGTVEETAEILRAVPGFAAAFATRGSEMPGERPVLAEGVPICATGRGARFGWVVTIDGGRAVHSTLVRIGARILQRGSPSAAEIEGHAADVRERGFPALVGGEDRRWTDPRGSYAGSQACATCHAEETAAHAESAHRRRPAAFPAEGLGRFQCLRCHVTGADAKTGWGGAKDGSDLAAVSCEACHGPGSQHVADPKAGWGTSGFDRCLGCHTPERSPDFDAKGLWEKWGHGLR